MLIGGTGHFGGRIAHRIAGEPNTELIVTSRNEASAAAVVSQILQQLPTAKIRPSALDQFSPTFEADLKKLKPNIVLHTAGPYRRSEFCNYGPNTRRGF